MERDPSLYVILSLDTNCDVVYSTVHLFNREGLIERTRVRNAVAMPSPYDELSEVLEWGAAAFIEYETN